MEMISLGFGPKNKIINIKAWLQSVSWVKVFLWLFAITLSMVCGVFVVAESYILVAILIGLPVGWFIFKWPQVWLGITIVGILVIPGLLELYFPQLLLVRWLFPLMASATSTTILFTYLFGCKSQKLGYYGKKCMILVLLFVIIAFFSSILNNGFSANALVGLKGYFQIWPILLGIVYSSVDTEKLARYFRITIIWVGLLQIPIALHQFFVLVPMRMTTKLAEEGVVAIDVVAGSFGAMLWGGGRSTVLGIFQMIAITLVTMQYRKNVISLRRLIVLVLLLIIPILVSEIKAFPFFLLLASGIIFRDVLIKYPFKFASYAFLLLAICSLLFVANFFLPATKGQQASSLDKFIDEAVSYNIGDKGYGNAVLNRTSVYSFWAKENVGKQDVVHLLTGYGPGATNAFTSIETESLAANLYPGFAIGLTSLSALLWESGLLGSIVLLGIIYYGSRAAIKVGTNCKSNEIQIFSTTLLVGLLLVFMTLLHVDYFVFDLSYQMIFIVALGCVVLLERMNAN